jgi:hypothetical protein
MLGFDADGDPVMSGSTVDEIDTVVSSSSSAALDADRAEAATLSIDARYKTVVLLLASVETTRGVGNLWEGGGLRFLEAAAGATDHDETTAGGIKLYRDYPLTLDFSTVTSPSTPTGASGAAGNPNGTYYYRITYITADGETSPGQVSGAIVAANAIINLTIPVSTNRLVTGRKIYRTLAGGFSTTVYLVATVSDNTTTAYADNIADGSLGAYINYNEQTGNQILDGSSVIGVTGASSTLFGNGALPTGGYASTAIGTNSLKSNTTGVRNTAVGHDSLPKNTTGATNVAMGVHAAEECTTGASNISIGYQSNGGNVAGSFNVAVGDLAAPSKTSGDKNVAVGAQAMQLSTGGDSNTAVGYQALRAGTTGVGNVGVGHGAGAALTTGNFNTHVGYLASGATTGNGNTTIGFESGQGITSGASNVTLGASAGKFITTESNRLFIDNVPRASYADSITKALITGAFAATPVTQYLAINGLLYAKVGVALPAAAITANYTVTLADHTINVTGTATVTLTIPNALNSVGKILHIRNKAAFTVVSANANVVPIAGGAASTAILPATAGAWATLQAIGSVWEIIAS